MCVNDPFGRNASKEYKMYVNQPLLKMYFSTTNMQSYIINYACGQNAHMYANTNLIQQ